MPRTGWLAGGAIGGALLVEHLGQGLGALMVVLLGASLALGIAALACARRPAALVALGVALVVARAMLSAADHAPPPAPHDLGSGPHRATVVAVYAPSGGMQRAVIELRQPAGSGVAGRAHATLPRYPSIAPGQVLELDGRLEPAPPAGESGFGEFLARSEIGFTLRSRSMAVVATDETPAAGLEQLRRAAGSAITRSLPEPQAGLAAAIVVGLRDLVARDVAADFRTSGLSHVVAISGFHIALVAAMAGALLRPLARRWRSLALLGLLAGYALLAGAAPSVLRATAMTGTVLLLGISGRRGRAAAALGMAVLLLLLVEPATVGEVGFQLSVAATAGLLRWAGPFAEWLRAHLPAALPLWLVETLAVSLAAQLATLPLVLLHFGRLSLVAPLANLLAAPLIAPAMASAGLGLAAGSLAEAGAPSVLLAPVQLLGALCVGALIAVARLCAALPLASVELPPPLDLAGAAVAGLIVLLALRRRPAVDGSPASPPDRQADATARRGATARRNATTQRDASAHRAATAQRPGPAFAQRHRMAGVLLATVAGVALVLGIVGAARPDGRLHMTVLDVGQGDAILLVGAAGSRMLIDTGPDPDLLLAQLDARLPAWDRRLDLVVITHPHEDHVAGVALLLDRYRIGAIAEPGMIGLGPGDAAFRSRLAELGRATNVVAAGDHFDFDGARVSIHWPQRGRVPLRPTDGGKAVNNVSIVLEIVFGERRLLLTGDVEEEIDAQLLAAGVAAPGSPPIDVLKVAHHGSATASTDAFLERVRPRLAVVSAGWGNSYGHPSPRTLARLEAAGAQVLRTDLDGSIELSTDGRDLRLSRSGGRPRPSRAELVPAPATGLGFCPIPTAPPDERSPPYNRSDGGALAPRGGSPVSRSRAARLAGPPRGGRRRGGRVPGWARRGPRPPAGRPAGRDGGAAARPGQGTAGHRSAA